MLHNLVLELKSLGHQPVVFIPFVYWNRLSNRSRQFNYPLVPMIPKPNTALRKIPNSFKRLQSWQFAYFHRKYKFQVFQAFGTFPAGVLTADFCVPRHIPFAVRGAGEDLQRFPEIGYGIRSDAHVDMLIRRALLQASRLIAQSQTMVDEFMKAGLSQDKIITISSGVQEKRFAECVVDPNMIRRRHNLPLGKFMFLTVGRNHPKKGFSVLLEAICKVKQRQKRPFHVVFAGRGVEQLQERIQQLNIKQEVTLLEEVGLSQRDKECCEIPARSLIELYKASDAFILPSLLEGFPVVSIEAMAAGIPVILTDAPGCRESVEHNISGLIARAGDAESLAQAMMNLQASATLRAVLVENAARILKEKHTLPIMAQRYEQMYLDMLPAVGSLSRG